MAWRRKSIGMSPSSNLQIMLKNGAFCNSLNLSNIYFGRRVHSQNIASLVKSFGDALLYNKLFTSFLLFSLLCSYIL